MRKKLLIACMTTVCILSFGCSQSEQMQTPKGELRDNTPVVLEPSADRELFFESETITLDASHTSDGYIMVQYHGTNEKTKLLRTMLTILMPFLTSIAFMSFHSQVELVHTKSVC